MDNRSSLWLKQAQGEHKWAQDAFRLAELFLFRARAELGDA